MKERERERDVGESRSVRRVRQREREREREWKEAELLTVPLFSQARNLQTLQEEPFFSALAISLGWPLPSYSPVISIQQCLAQATNAAAPRIKSNLSSFCV